MARTTPAQTFRRAFAILEKKFGRREGFGSHTPVQQALVTLLLKDGREDYALRSIRRLEQEFVDWNEVRVCEPGMLDGVLGHSYPAGVGQLIRSALTAIFNHSQSMNLDDLLELKAEEAETFLRKLSSMPSRVAGELLLAKLKYDKLPPTAGLLRVARRMKLTGQPSADEQIRSLRRLASGGMIPRVFHVFEVLAERCCVEQNCNCSECPVIELCSTGEEKLAKIRAQMEKERAAREAEEQRLKLEQKRQRQLAVTQKLKEALAKRKEKMLGGRKRKKAVKAPAPPTKMVQASSAEVKYRRPKGRRKGLRGRRRSTRKT